MDWMLQTVDLYCERTSSDFWSEPVNALTNGFFLVGAWFGWRRSSTLGTNSRGVWALLALMCIIGVGSFLFHTLATNWSRICDVIPILLFQLVYIWLYCREIARIRFGRVLAIVLVYVAAAITGRLFPQVLNGSMIYAPSMVALIALGAYHFSTHRIERYVALGATGLFMASLVFRTVDNALCANFPLGSHFMWHVCNALVLYLLLRGFLANRHVSHFTNKSVRELKLSN
jgi:hypothetical protein